jgi:thiamine-monophosphate kinase
LGCTVYEDKIPIDQQTWDTARSFDMDPTMLALNGGEDYELVFTISQDNYEKMKDIQQIIIIGYMTEASAGINLITKNNVSAPITAQGWDGLKANKS